MSAGRTSSRSSNFFMHSYYSKTGNFVKLMIKVSMNGRIEEVSGSTFDAITRRRLVENQDTILELTGKIQELQNEINCLNDSRDFQDAESVRSGHSHVTSQPVFFPPHPIPGGMLSRSIGMPSRREGPPSILDTHGFSGNVFADPVASPTAPYPQELNPWSSGISEPIHSSTAEKNEKPTPVQGQRYQSGPSAKSSFNPNEGRFSKNYGARPTTTADSRSSFRQIPHTSNVCVLEDKIQNWGMYLFTISYGSYVLDQRSGDGWFSGWFNVFVIYKRNSNAEFWSTRCEDCFSTEQNHP